MTWSSRSSTTKHSSSSDDTATPAARCTSSPRHPRRSWRRSRATSASTATSRPAARWTRTAGTQELTELYCYGPQKAVVMVEFAAERGIDLAASYAYSDSATDIPMLESVGHAVAVNPDRELQRAAREHGWEIRTFTRPCRLRDRMPTPRPGPTTAVGGLVAAAIGGGVLWWWLRRDPGGTTKRTAGRSAAVDATRRAPFGRRRQRARQERRREAASSWRRILDRSSPSRSAPRSGDRGSGTSLPRRVRGRLPLLN